MNELICSDCLVELPKLPEKSVDLVFVDPPFNINFEYDVYEDNKSVNEYLDWCLNWGFQIKRVLKSNGAFWLAIGDSFASDLDCLFRRELYFIRRSWVIWHYTFGVNCTNKFTPSHTHLFHYVVNPKDFVFNSDAIKVLSARQAVYGDKRGKIGGRIPNDVWCLNPKEENYFQKQSDTWYYPRIAGTFKERIKGFPCQMPLVILKRIIEVSSNPGDTVLDPMFGSCTTGVAAKNLNRNFIGIELSENYFNLGKERFQNVSESKSTLLFQTK